MQIGVTVSWRGQDVTCHVTGGRAALPLVSQYHTTSYSAVVLGRLYYREELLGALRPRLPAQLTYDAGSNPAALVLAAYRHSELEGLSRLEGDFALVLWDGVERRLVGMRDPLGGYPLFWARAGDVVAFSTSLRQLLRLLPGHTLDLEYLADYLMLPSGMGEVQGCRCAYEGATRVQAGTVVSFVSPDRDPYRLAYWNWLDQLESPDPARHDDVAVRVGELLRRAVAERLEGVTASHLSGGMDSTSVALLARDQLAAAGRGPLHSLSLVYQRMAGLAQETPYLETVLSRPQDMVPHRIPGDDLLAFDDFNELPPHDEPWPGLEQLATRRAVIEVAAGVGADTILTGSGGDELLDLAPYHLSELLRRGRLWSAWSEAARWAQADGLGLWEILYPYGVANLLPAWARGGLGLAWRGGYASWVNQGSHTIPPWVRPRFARRFGLRARALEHLRRAYSSCRPTGLSVALESLISRVGERSRWYLAAPRGIAVAQPFLDARLARFCLGLHGRVPPTADRQKPFLADAMRGVLPEAIRNRRNKGDFNEPYFRGLARNLPRLEALIREAPLPHPDLFDREVMLDCLRRAALGVAGGAMGVARLGLALALLAWLASRDAWHRLPEEEGAVTPWSASGAFAGQPRPAPELLGQV